MTSVRPHVLVTRPEGQQHGVVARLRAAGYQVSHAPALDIAPLALSAQDRQRLLDIDQYHAVFFVSSNAARFALAQLDTLWPQWPEGVHWLAVGPATAQVLATAGLPVEVPESGFDSEAVLALPALADLQGRRILICRGEGGREWFADTLRGRGAEVEVISFYQRRCNPNFAWPELQVDVLMITSGQGWQCACARVPANCTVIVASERVAELVRPCVSRVLVASSATDDDMVAALQSAFPVTN
jgi:uroporphyrinogen-III synthase